MEDSSELVVFDGDVEDEALEVAVGHTLWFVKGFRYFGVFEPREKFIVVHFGLVVLVVCGGDELLS